MTQRAEPDDLGSRLGPVLSFMRELWAMEHGLNARSKAMNRHLGVTGPQRLVLRLLGSLGPLTAGELAHLLHLHPASVSRLVRALESRGLLEARRDSHDLRRRILRPTRAARRAMQRRDGTVEAAIQRALAGARPVEVASALALVERIATELARGS